jgi:hypothetical protein
MRSPCLLEGFGGVLRLAAVTRKALLRCEAAACAGFGVFGGVSCAGGHGAFLRCV